MIINKTVKCKLQVDTEQAIILLETLGRFASACNDILSISKDSHSTHRVSLHHLCYYKVKERYELQANLVVRAIARVASTISKNPRKFNPTSMDLDCHTFSIKGERVSISTVGGRLKLNLIISDFQRKLLDGKSPTSAVLVYDKQKRAFYIHIGIKQEAIQPESIGQAIGIDRGIYNLATTSTKLKFSGRHAMHVRKHYSKLRQSLQSKGTKGTKCLLKRLAGKEQRAMKDLNHKISKAIVQSCQPGDTLVMEDLKYIRDRIKIARKQRQIQHSWAFGQLGSFIEYKAAERGVKVVYVDPKYTSQRCPKCGIASKNSRHKHIFKCSSCGYTANADLNAAFNIRQVYLDMLADGLSSTSP
jgi:IS605 OrfB family transposase